MWSAVCLMAPHSQFEKGARLHLCMDEQKHPTPECWRLSLTQDILGKPIPEGLKAWIADVLFREIHVPLSEAYAKIYREGGQNQKAVKLWCKKKTKSFCSGQSP